MVNELKILFKNIKNFRSALLNEAAGEGSIRDAINDNKILYIYYNGDETVQKGYRTIRPFVLGSHKQSGNKVLRAWQDAGSSASYRNIPTNSRWGHRYQKGHEYFDNPKRGGTQPGWRLFRIDKIASILPTGEKFTPNEYFNVSGVEYNPNDQEINVDVAIPKDFGADTKVSGTDSISEPDKISTKVQPSTFDKQGKKFKQFFKAAKKTREITKDEVESLWNAVKKYRKKSPKNYHVIENEKGDMVLVTNKAVERGDVPNEAIIGNLQDLYNKFVKAKGSIPTDFYNKQKNDLLNQKNKK
jgi:hypothetical protein